jgi:hypothetical protein
MTIYYGQIKVKGYADKDRYTYNYNLGNLLDEAAGVAALSEVYNALAAITLGTIEEVSIKSIVSTSAAQPAYGVNTREQAVVSAYLNAAGTKLHNVVIPAPVDEIVNPNGMDVDVTNADLITYIAALADNVQVSDGESIDTTVTNGMKEGHTRTVSKSYN